MLTVLNQYGLFIVGFGSLISSVVSCFLFVILVSPFALSVLRSLKKLSEKTMMQQRQRQVSCHDKVKKD